MASTVFEGEKRPEQETGGEEGCRRWLVCGLISRLLAAWLSPHTPAFELELTADEGTDSITRITAESRTFDVHCVGLISIGLADPMRR